MSEVASSAAVFGSLANQLKVSKIVSSYPDSNSGGGFTAIGAIARGATVDSTTTKQVATTAFNQGQFFKAFSKVSFDQLARSTESDGDETWSYTKAIDGVDHSVTLRKSEVLSTISLTQVQSQAEIDAVAKQYAIDPKSTYITVDGVKYFVRMNIPLHFGAGTQSSVIMDTLYFVLGTEGLGAAVAGVVAKLGIEAFGAALTNINTAVFRVLWSLVAGVVQVTYAFLQAFVGAVLGGESVAAALAAGQLAVGEAFAEGAFTAITASALAYTIVGVLVIAAIFLILTYALHYSYQNVYIYNLTKYDLDFDFGYLYEGTPHNLESKHLPAYQKRIGPNSLDLGSWYSGTAFRFQSDSQFYGLGYALTLALKDAGTQVVRKQMACMFDVPYAAGNSLRASATLPNDIRNFYLSNEGVFSRTLDYQNDGELELIVTYDYLSGKHRDPETGDNDYIYNSLVIVREKATGFSLNPSAGLTDNGFLEIPNRPEYAFAQADFCLEAWIRPTAAGTLFGKKSTAGGGSAYAGLLLVIQPNGTIKFATDNGFGFSQIVSQPTNLFDGHWHHVAGVRSAGKLLLYVDGQPVAATASGSLPSPLNVSNALSLQLGAVQQNQEPHVHYAGAISEARVWNVALARPQIQQGLNAPLTGSERGLVGYWPLHSNGDDLSHTKNPARIVGNVRFGDH